MTGLDSNGTSTTLNYQFNLATFQSGSDQGTNQLIVSYPVPLAAVAVNRPIKILVPSFSGAGKVVVSGYGASW